MTWRVTDASPVIDATPYDLALELVNDEQPEMRLAVLWREGDEDPEIIPYYPCAVCGWDGACPEGECHS